MAGNRLFVSRIQIQENPPNFVHIGGQFVILPFPHRPHIARSRSNVHVIGTRADVRQSKYFVLFPKVRKGPLCATCGCARARCEDRLGSISGPLRLLILPFSFSTNISMRIVPALGTTLVNTLRMRIRDSTLGACHFVQFGPEDSYRDLPHDHSINSFCTCPIFTM